MDLCAKSSRVGRHSAVKSATTAFVSYRFDNSLRLVIPAIHFRGVGRGYSIRILFAFNLPILNILGYYSELKISGFGYAMVIIIIFSVFIFWVKRAKGLWG